MHDQHPLRIALLTYRGHPYTGGQGIYIRHLSRELIELGHTVEVFSGPPYPELDPRVKLTELNSLDLYRMPDPFRIPKLREFEDWTFVLEFVMTAGIGFAEPLAFSLRVNRELKDRVDEFDIVQDNQCLGYGILQIQKTGLPVLGTIHHPIPVDRRVEMEHAPNPWKRFTKRRFYAFTKMQTRVAKRLRRIITVSSNSYKDIVTEHGVDPDRLHIVHVGVDPDHFKPSDDIQVVPGRIMTTASADVAMKGLRYLLESFAKLRTEHDASLVIIGKPKYDSPTLAIIEKLGIGDDVEFISGVSDQRIVDLYNEAELAVVPSLYEGFSLPAVEAMACGVPLIATTGGALPEVVGEDGVTAIHVEPGNVEELTEALLSNIGRPELRETIGLAGRKRVIDNYSWRITAERTVDQYRALLAEIAAEQVAGEDS
jgi:MMP alpha-(1->4)-mannosyltransferase